jgi:ATP-binding cassette, subfamily B, bacterial
VAEPHARTASDWRLTQRLFAQARPYWGHIAALFALGLLATPLALAAPLPLKLAVDSALGSEPLPGWLAAAVPDELAGSPAAVLSLSVALILVVALTTQLQRAATSSLRTWTGEKLVLDFRARLFRHVQRLSLSYHDRRGTADSSYRIQNDASAVPNIVIDGLAPFVAALTTFASMLYVSFRIDGQLALVALAISPILFGVARAYRRNLRNRSRQVKRLESAALGVIQEVLGALGIVKGFAQEEREQARFLAHANEGLSARMRLSLASEAMDLILGLTTAAGSAAVLWFGVRHVREGRITLGDLLLVMGYLGQIYEPLRTISRRVATLQSHLASAERAFALLDEAPDVVEQPNARRLARARGAVSVESVCFAYDAGPRVLHDVSFEIPAGTRVGILGKTGAGKTTLLRLLMRFYDPSAGCIRLDGIDLRELRVADLRNQFSLVPQEPILFSTSVAENIAYARPGAREGEIVRAAQAAYAHEFIAALPRGYATRVGERGMSLSGGERQRIALARAFLKDAPLLVLDEPTSSVDLRTEALIVEAMEQLMEGRTTFVIAHRLHTLESCDVLLRLEGGRLAELRSDVPRALRESLAPPARAARERSDG